MRSHEPSVRLNELVHPGAGAQRSEEGGVPLRRAHPHPLQVLAQRIELRAAGSQDVWVSIGEQRWHIDGYGSEVVLVPVGQHPMTVRSGDGHVLWARGRIDLTKASEVIVQLSEGRMPEVSGTGAAFHPGR